MHKVKNLFRIVFCLAALACAASAQEVLGTYQIRVAPDRDDWTYELNQPARFQIAVTLNNRPVAGLPLKYACGPEMLAPTVEKTATSSAAPLTIEAGTMKEPGFLRCVVTMEKNGANYRGVATAGFRPEQIKPTVKDPADFDKFWADSLAQLANLPVDSKMELLPALSTPKADVYHVNFQNIGLGSSRTSRLYGILAVPKATAPDQKFPAMLRVPGAGVRPYTGQVWLAERGVITLEIGIHGIPVNLPAHVYEDLRTGALNRYTTYNMDDRDTYYYRRVYLGCVRANDFLTSLPQYDGRNLAVTGGSQGGALAIVTAGLDPRVKVLSSTYPALADLTGYLNNRAGGWPHFFHPTRPGPKPTPEALRTLPYYDVVNFARRVKVPGIYTWGYNDETVPPTSIFSAYNVITAPKVWMLALTTGHNTTPEQTARMDAWLMAFLKVPVARN